MANSIMNSNSSNCANKKGNKTRNKSIDQLGSTSFSVTSNSIINTSEIVQDLSQISHNIELNSDELASVTIHTSSTASENASMSLESSKSGIEKKRNHSKSKLKSKSNTNISNASDISEDFDNNDIQQTFKKKDSWKLIAYLVSHSNFGIRCNF